MTYTVPTAANLKARYPAFAAVADVTVDYWIEDGERFVTTSWAVGDYAPALMAYAAHRMALEGLGTGSAVGIPAGVTSFKSGTFSVGFSDTVANAQSSGGWEATRYGVEFRVMLRRNTGLSHVMQGVVT